MKEIEVTAKLVKKFNAIPGCRAKKRHSGKFGSGAPDFNGCYIGRAFFIETKMDTGALTELQAEDLDKWMDAGATTALAIYLPGTKEIHVVTPSSPEFRWGSVVGQENLRRVLAEPGYRARLKDFDPHRVIPELGWASSPR